MAGRVSVKKSDPPETTEILAEAIIRLGDGMQALTKSGLNRRAIVTLLHDKTKISKTDINAVIDGMAQLRGWYCRD
ncbi:MAG: hypothetical protein AAFR65_10435 [Pseudomonadota bacterium]